YMNKTSSRVGYVVAKVVSIILIAILIIAFLVAFVLFVQGIVVDKNIKMYKIFELLWFFLFFHLFFVLLLYLFALVVLKSALIFTLGIFLVLIETFAESFLPMIPKI